MANLHGKDKAKHVVRLFRRIANSYDLLNTLMSGGRHRDWRKQAIQMFNLSKNGIAIDVATGTGDFSIEISQFTNVEKVFGVDFAKEMVALAQKKSLNLKTNNKLFYIEADASFLPFKNSVFQYATIGFGIRNFYDLSKLYGTESKSLGVVFLLLMAFTINLIPLVSAADGDNDGVEDGNDDCPDTVAQEGWTVADNGCSYPSYLDSIWLCIGGGVTVQDLTGNDDEE